MCDITGLIHWGLHLGALIEKHETAIPWLSEQLQQYDGSFLRSLQIFTPRIWTREATSTAINNTIGIGSPVGTKKNPHFLALHLIQYWNLAEAAHEVNLSIAIWILLTWPLRIVSDMVESLAYFHNSKLSKKTYYNYAHRETY